MRIVALLRFVVVAKDGGLNIPCGTSMATEPEIGSATALVECGYCGDELGNIRNISCIRHARDVILGTDWLIDRGQTLDI
jgi:hypothetical protein